MDEKFLCILFIVLVFISCNHKSDLYKSNKEVGLNQKLSISNTDIELNKTDGNLIEIALFSKCTNFDNNLSTVASNIKFVHLAEEPPINDFHTYDVQISEEYIFLADLYNIRQYDLQGNFLKNIGKRGMGPAEFVQIMPPIQLDRDKELIYARDGGSKKIVIYRFDGSFVSSIRLQNDIEMIDIIDTTTIAVRQTMSERRRPNCPLIRFIDYEGKLKKVYPSHLYPYNGRERGLGSSENFLWENNSRFYYLEYGNDTIYRILKDSIVPVRKLTGNLILKPYNFFSNEIGENLIPFTYILRPNAAIFESDSYIIFRLKSQWERFFMVYNKQTGYFQRTNYSNPPIFHNRGIGDEKKMDYFIDDMVTGLYFNPQYQSMGKAIALIPATEIVEKKDIILHFMSEHPSEEAAKLKSIVEGMNELDNPLIVITTFK
ncbi:MAG: 6-bladed beta-propeller [Tannerella sp.]|jgi:hypothetical protein|nr:6-bladed beta-propeller [Tannerella sp.]